MTLTLQQRIESLAKQYTADVQAKSSDLAEAARKRQTLQHKLEQVRFELAQVDAAHQRLEEALESAAERFQQEGINPLLVNALTQSQKDIGERLGILRLQQRPFARLPQEELRPSDPLRIVLVMLSNLQESQISWVLPLPQDADAYPDDIADLLDEFSEMCIYVILRIGQHEDWYFAGMGDEATEWQGFASQTTLMEYSGGQPMVVSAGDILQSQFDALLASEQSGPFQGLSVVVDVATLTQDSWQRIAESAQATEPVPEEVPVEPSIPLFERSLGWYKDDDVAAWNRPLRVTENSAWTVQGRRLRTALISLIARGHLGSDYVAQRYLWQTLPSPHQEAMREGINRLLEHSLLQTAGDPGHNGEMLIAVNPEMIERVQELINRQVDESWQSIINL